MMAANELGLDLGLEYHDVVADLILGAAKRRQLSSQSAALRLPEGDRILAIAAIQFGRAPFNVTGARSDREKHDFACRHCLQSFV
ncbi:hypothetical protein BN77_0765 [Rhizobium mesoamericanum STM3625]|uniref:Uncharacterized protein n=1 Tax=Rhizobium mesoamericanum STM3625 TaxID=1211777 RepID=K0Q4G1_9HYPH|nr:hypothetical protein BN77_0765 [Rhizobium mesoamericanum STM3625]